MYFLTGESKAAAYQVDNNSNGGSFRQIQIKHPLSAGGWGAFALTARLSEVNLNSGPYQGSYLRQSYSAGAEDGAKRCGVQLQRSRRA